MSGAIANTWHEVNQRYLMASLATVRESLEVHMRRSQGTRGRNGSDPTPRPITQEPDLDSLAPPALQTLCAAFALSPFERDVLLMCAGGELDWAFPSLCAAAQGEPPRPYPTFSLALAALPEAHWSALTPAAPLRHASLIEVAAGDTLTLSPLRIDERVLHYLAGVSYLDERLHGLLHALPAPAQLPPSHADLTRRITQFWPWLQRESPSPMIQLCGGDYDGKLAIAASACAALGIQLHVLRAADIPVALAEREDLARLWQREAVLTGSALLIECDDLDNTDKVHAALSLFESIQGMLFVTARQRLLTRKREVIRLDVNKPSATEQLALWRRALNLDTQKLNGHVEAVIEQFHLGMQGIHAASVEVLANRRQGQEEMLGPLLWDACRDQSRPRLDDLAQRIEPAATWEDLVLPEARLQTLREISAQVRQRARVYDVWGFSTKGARGLGINVLFAGSSGTGKTMAAEVLANDLRLDLYRIDLSQVVSKYIGETEKNLRRVFDAAEEGGVILLFDEADALFGKRTEVKDSHDRYANIEVSYLLQRMEAYRGLAILTTNMKNSLDIAFLRRIRFIVQFPFPDAKQRAAIWPRIFPRQTPTENLDMNRLAQLNVAGGNIRNIALNAAFLAADAGEPVRMAHLLRAARTEYNKLEKPLTDAEIGGWV